MPEIATDNKRIARNTLVLYFRMMFTMAISLYTSRIVLQNLGVEDYGIYQVVGGIVGLLSFINGTLSRGTSRFLLFEIGRGNPQSVSRLFSTLLNAHIFLAVCIIFIAETIGLWFLHNKLMIPADRMQPAIIAFHLSVFTSFFSLTQTPFSAAIKSHEHFEVYAYTSIIDAVAKLVIVYLLTVSPIDRLAFYALLLCIESIVMTMYLKVYCMRHFEETRYHLIFDLPLLKKVTSYCGWNFFSNLSSVLNTQGLYMLVNMFFNAGVVTSIAIATTVKNVANSFVENFRVASIPQIVKSYASGEHDRSKDLLLSTTKYSYFLILLLGLPIFLVAPQLLRLWLGFIPLYADIFLRLIILVNIFMLFNSCLYTAQDVIGKIKRYSIIFPFMMLLNIAAVYVFFKNGAPPVVYAIILLVTYILLALVIQPILVVWQTEYTYKEIYRLYFQCLYVTLVAIIIPILAYKYLPIFGDFFNIVLISVISICSVCISVWYLGVDLETKKKILTFIKQKLHIKK